MAKGILVITGIGSTPCPLEGLKSTLDSITLNEMSFRPSEELYIDAKGLSMPPQGQACATKAFLVDEAQAQPTGDEAFIRRVEAVPMRVMFEPKEGTDQPMDGIDVLSHAKINHITLPSKLEERLAWLPQIARGDLLSTQGLAYFMEAVLNAAIGYQALHLPRPIDALHHARQQVTKA